MKTCLTIAIIIYILRLLIARFILSFRVKVDIEDHQSVHCSFESTITDGNDPEESTCSQSEEYALKQSINIPARKSYHKSEAATCRELLS